MSAIKVEKLSKQFKYYKKAEGLIGSLKNIVKRVMLTKDAVSDVSLEIAEGEFVGFIGPNGAGKTTTIKMLSGILEPTSGSIDCLGHAPKDRKKEYQKQIGVVLGQKNQINPDLPPMETFLLFRDIYGLDEDDFRSKLAELTELLDIGDLLSVQARRLSLGQRMKCELVAALLHSPKLLFLDEPTIGLDVTSQRNIREFLAEYNRKHKTTIILTSHYMQDIERLCKRIVIIDLGKIIFDGSLTSLTKEYVKNKKISVLLDIKETLSCERASKYGKVLECDKDKLSIEIPREKVPEVTAKLIKDFNIKDLEISEMDIEDIISDIFLRNKLKGKK